MIVISDYRGFRIEVDAIGSDGRWNAHVRIRRTLSSDKPHHERLSCYKPTAEYAEWAGMLSARRWIDRQEFRRERAVITLDQRKVSLILEFLKESFGAAPSTIRKLGTASRSSTESSTTPQGRSCIVYSSPVRS